MRARACRCIVVLGLASVALLGQFMPRKTIVGRIWMEKVPAAHVAINLQTANGTTIATMYSDPDGRFSFSELSGGIYQVSASVQGFQPVSQSVNLGATGDEAEVSLFLRHTNDGGKAQPGPLSSPSLQKKALASYQQGRQLLDAKKYAEAIAPLTEAVAAAPLSALAYNDLGSAYFGARKLPEARRSWQQALRIDSHFAPAAVNLARLENDRNRWQQALKLLQQASGQGTDMWPYHLERGRSEYGLQQWQAAFADLNQAVQLGGGQQWPQIYALRANLYVRAGQFPQARRDFETYLKLAPTGTLAPKAKQIVADMVAHGVPEPAP
jgi:tetratricopeptide (TPR) repeat protein